MYILTIDKIQKKESVSVSCYFYVYVNVVEFTGHT
jgi:hypothetical protein